MSLSSTVHIRPPFRAEHVGSLLRPPSLLQSRSLLIGNNISHEQHKAVVDEAIKSVVKLQRDIGMKTITDGEFRRGRFFEGVFENLEGMTIMPRHPIAYFKPYIPHIKMMISLGVQESDTIYCTGKIKRRNPFYVDDFKHLKSIVPAQDVNRIKITMCSPSWFHQRHGSDMTYDPSVYNSDEEYFNDIGAAYREEFKELYDLGCRHIQIDDPTFCYFCAESMISGMEAAGVNHEALLDTYIRAINVCTQGRPADLTVSIHMCRGNFTGGAHFCEGSYSRISLKLFNTLDVDAFYLEYDSERAGDFKPLRHLPIGKVAVLGLVTTKNGKLETVKALEDRVYEAVDVLMQGNPRRSREVALDQLCISPQCGFASVYEGNPITVEDEKKKLALLVETAKQIWPEKGFSDEHAFRE